MNGKEQIKGTQGTKKSREVEEKIKALEQPDADTRELKRRYLLRRFWKSAAEFWASAASGCRGFSPETLLLIILA